MTSKHEDWVDRATKHLLVQMAKDPFFDQRVIQNRKYLIQDALTQAERRGFKRALERVADLPASEAIAMAIRSLEP